MTITVLLFAGIAEKLGVRVLQVPWSEGDTIERVRDRLVADHPALSVFLPSVLYALNEEYVKPGHEVSAGDTLALIPPVSGG
ncbi:MAG: MoaD/ThiS family protein [Dehalococcoidia bacterium]